MAGPVCHPRRVRAESGVLRLRCLLVNRVRRRESADRTSSWPAGSRGGVGSSSALGRPGAVRRALAACSAARCGPPWLAWRSALIASPACSWLRESFLRGAVAARAEMSPYSRPGRSASRCAWRLRIRDVGIQWSFITYLTLFLPEHEFTLPRALALAQALERSATDLGLAERRFGRRVAIRTAWRSCRPARSVPCKRSKAPLPIVAVSGFAIVGWNGAYHALLADRAGPGRVGRMSGDALAIVYGGPVVLPPLLGLVVDATGSWRVLWLVCAALVGAAAIMLRIAFDGRRRPLRRRRSRG